MGTEQSEFTSKHSNQTHDAVVAFFSAFPQPPIQSQQQKPDRIEVINHVDKNVKCVERKFIVVGKADVTVGESQLNSELYLVPVNTVADDVEPVLIPNEFFIVQAQFNRKPVFESQPAPPPHVYELAVYRTDKGEFIAVPFVSVAVCNQPLVNEVSEVGQ